jgi:uncharacterized protein YecT (DUF1311 family)
MPQVNLSTLSGVELRQLLDTSRRRGDAALSYKVLQEMAARRDAPAERRKFLAQAQAEPHPIEVDLGDPADDDDDLPPMPNWRPPAQAAQDPPPSPTLDDAAAGRRGRRKPPAAAAVAPEPPMPVEDVEPPPIPRDADRPLSLWAEDSAPIGPAPVADRAARVRGNSPRSGSAKAAGPKSAYRPRLRLVLGFALGIAAGTALGFWVGQMPPDAPPRPAPAAAPIQTAALAPPPAAEPAPPTPAAPSPDAQADPTAISPAAPPNAQEAVGDADSRTAEPPPPPPAEPARSAEIATPAERPASAAAASGCASAPTPADHAICGDAKLRRLQDELRRAYAEALDAHEDRALLREHQLAWRDARNTVTDPDRLAALYEERIRKLNAATAEALRAR